jgi:hypothetical protein
MYRIFLYAYFWRNLFFSVLYISVVKAAEKKERTQALEGTLAVMVNLFPQELSDTYVSTTLAQVSVQV